MRGFVNRQALMAKSGGGAPTAADYVQDGLIAMWDGIENAGWGTHDASATTWKDLVGGEVLSSTDFSNYSWINGGLFYNGSSSQATSGMVGNNAISNVLFIEVLFRVESLVTESCVIGNRVGNFFPALIIYSTGMCLTKSGRPGQTYPAGTLTARTINLFSFSCNDDVSPINFKNAQQITIETTGNTWGSISPWKVWMFQFNSNRSRADMTIYSARFYNRKLSESEVAHNYSVDKARFNLP